MVPTPRTKEQGHKLKYRKSHFRKDFDVEVGKHCNRLPREVIRHPWQDAVLGNLLSMTWLWAHWLDWAISWGASPPQSCDSLTETRQWLATLERCAISVPCWRMVHAVCSHELSSMSEQVRSPHQQWSSSEELCGALSFCFFWSWPRPGPITQESLSLGCLLELLCVQLLHLNSGRAFLTCCIHKHLSSLAFCEKVPWEPGMRGAIEM